jgi:hypothetical protein
VAVDISMGGEGPFNFVSLGARHLLSRDSHCGEQIPQPVTLICPSQVLSTQTKGRKVGYICDGYEGKACEQLCDPKNGCVALGLFVETNQKAESKKQSSWGRERKGKKSWRSDGSDYSQIRVFIEFIDIWLWGLSAG